MIGIKSYVTLEKLCVGLGVLLQAPVWQELQFEICKLHAILETPKHCTAVYNTLILQLWKMIISDKIRYSFISPTTEKFPVLQQESA